MLCWVILVQEIKTGWCHRGGCWKLFRDQVLSCDYKTLQRSSACASALFGYICRSVSSGSDCFRDNQYEWNSAICSFDMVMLLGFHSEEAMNGRMRTCHQYNLLYHLLNVILYQFIDFMILFVIVIIIIITSEPSSSSLHHLCRYSSFVWWQTIPRPFPSRVEPHRTVPDPFKIHIRVAAAADGMYLSNRSRITMFPHARTHSNTPDDGSAVKNIPSHYTHPSNGHLEIWIWIRSQCVHLFGHKLFMEFELNA